MIRPMMMMTSKKILAAALAAGLAASCPAAEEANGLSDADRATASAALTRYLADHGDFCLGKMDWPVDLSALDLRSRNRDVLQMPVLERLGLVTASDATALRLEGPGADEEGAKPAPVAVRRYQLTAQGERWMREREIVVPGGPAGDRLVHRRDLCAAHLALDAVTDWRAAGSPDRYVATYTFVAAPAPWAADAGFQQVFPMAARVLGGSHAMALKQAFRRVGDQWLPDGLSD